MVKNILVKNKQVLDEIFTDFDVNDLSEEKISLIKQKLLSIRQEIDNILLLLEGDIEGGTVKLESTFSTVWKPRKAYSKIRRHEIGAREIIEGVFDGECMIGADGQKYSVPENYASKSKLVEGDILKLIISKDGSFTYKQISPIERKRLIGELVYNEENGLYFVKLGNNSWKILNAAVKYFNGEPGDEVIFLIPKNGISSWAAVENILPKNRSEQSEEIFENTVSKEQGFDEDLEINNNEIQELTENDLVDDFDEAIAKIKEEFYKGLEIIDRLIEEDS